MGGGGGNKNACENLDTEEGWPNCGLHPPKAGTLEEVHFGYEIIGYSSDLVEECVLTDTH